MIIVIADDFTGAAEMAGISLGYGLKVSLCIDALVDTTADVLIVSTESRSMKKELALNIVKQVTIKAKNLNPDWIYKKIDSVLRGYVADEVQMQLEALSLKKALILPANPSLGRTIVGGQYFVDGIPISKTAFANDPEFAINTSDIQEMFKHENSRIVSKGSSISEGLNIGETGLLEDVFFWAGQVNGNCLPAGSGDFFDALLKKQYNKQRGTEEPQLQKPHLYVSGTSFIKSRDLIKYFGSSYTAFITADMLRGNNEAAWLNKVGIILNHHQQLIIAFDETVNNSEFTAAELRVKMAVYVKEVINQFGIREVLIEGGATATAIFQVFGFNCFEPVYEWQRGVVQMKAENFMVTVKPGSYELPHNFKVQYKLHQDV